MKKTLTSLTCLYLVASLFAAAPVINSFTADTPDAPIGSAIVLRWDVNRGGDAATTITLVESGTDLSATNLIGLNVQPATLVPIVSRATVGWRYYGEEAAPPADWKNSGFDDSTWTAPLTAAPIAYGDAVTTTLAAPVHRKPFYFRRTFDLTQEQIDTYLQFAVEAVRDDAVIVYLNGVEIARNNLPLGEPTHDTFSAVSVDANEDAFYRFPVPKTAVHAGTNTLAIAVYQRSTTSSDIRFDAGFAGFQITRQTNVSPFGSVWKYSSDGLTPAADWNLASFDDTAWSSGQGPLGFRETNLGTVLSYGADANNKPLAHYLRRKFTVAKDQVQELRLWARYGDGAAIYLNGVRVDLPATDTTTANFLNLTRPLTHTDATTTGLADRDNTGWGNADASILPRLVMTPTTHPEVFAALANGENTVAVSIHPASVTDTDLRFDLRLESNTSADPGTPVIAPLLPEFSTWSYLDGGADPGTGWSEKVYDDSTWKTGPGNFGYGYNNITPATTLPLSPAGNTFSGKAFAHHFRRKITLTNEQLSTLVNARANLRVDDGYVLYVNGVEISRSANLPAGVIDHNTPTTGSRGEVPQATISDQVTIPKARLVAGENLIAVEVHQFDTASTDIWFDLSLDLLAAAASPVYTLRASNVDGTVESTFSPTVSPHDFSLPAFLNHNVVTANSWSSAFWTNGSTATADKDYQLNSSYGPILTTSSSVPTFPGRSLTMHPGSILSVLHSDTVSDLRLAGGRISAGSTTDGALTLYGALNVQKESILDGGTLGCSLNMPISGSARLRLFSSTAAGTITLLGASPSYSGSFLMMQGVLNFAASDTLNNVPVVIDNGTLTAATPLVSTGPLNITNRFGTARVNLATNMTFASVTLPSGSAVPAGTYTTANLPAEAGTFFTGAGSLTVTQPTLVDTDTDGLEDTWELANFGDLGALATDDADNDGVNNLGEYIAGTDPKNAGSVLRVFPASLTGGNVVFSLPTQNGATYKLQSSPVLGTAASWVDVPGATVQGDGTTKSLNVPTGANSSLFIRAVISR